MSVAGAVFGQAKAPALPTDLNQASLRVDALDTLYDLDLSPEQLKALRAAASNTASTQHRTAVKANAELAKAFGDFQTALLTSKDDGAISKLRDHVAELAVEVDLDDDVQPTDAARAQAPAFCKQIKASQIAAFLVSRADQVADPTELLLSGLEGIRDIREEGGATAAAEAANLTTEVATSVSYLVYGNDEAKAKALAAQVSGWLKTGSALSESAFTAQEAARAEAAKKMIGEVDPLEVLGHWLALQMAQLISNPELPAAIDATLAARTGSK